MRSTITAKSNNSKVIIRNLIQLNMFVCVCVCMGVCKTKLRVKIQLLKMRKCFALRKSNAFFQIPANLIKLHTNELQRQQQNERNLFARITNHVQTN